jgi:alpha-mannosidase
VPLQYDVSVTSHEGEKSSAGFDELGNAIPAEMLPAEIRFDGVKFQLGSTNAGAANAVTAQGQTIELPPGRFNRVYLIAAGRGAITVAVGRSVVGLNIEPFNGFIGQWDDRVWSSHDTSHDEYGEMLGINPGFIKRADVAWYCDHYHDASGDNVPYNYSYLFAYALDLPAGVHTVTLPKDPGLRLLAMSVAEGNPRVMPVQPLYDQLPAGREIDQK